MPDPTAQIAELEWANYVATRSSVDATPEIDLVMEEQVILTSSQAFPMPDANHACLLRATPDTADALIERIVAHFASLGLPPTVYLSPACTPGDLGARLLARGFHRHESQEAWMIVEDLENARIPRPRPGIQVREARTDEALVVAQVFLRSFDMPVEFAPAMAELLAPSLGLPGVHYYLAFAGDRPLGTCSWHRHERFAVLGSAGVLPEIRGSAAAHNLGVAAIEDARRAGVETLILQTAANTVLERMLRIYGFRRAFLRTEYTLEQG